MLSPFLVQAVLTDQPAHAYVLLGEDALEQAALLAMALNCADFVPPNPCGICLSCRKIRHHNHPDVLYVEPDQNKLKVEQMHEMIAQAQYTKYEGKYKVFIIDKSDTMNTETGNSLLKILEDPPVDTIFILAANSSDKLLPTVLSRARIINTGVSGASLLDESRIGVKEADAAAFLRELPRMQLYQVLDKAASMEKDRDDSMHFLAACLRMVRFSLLGGSFADAPPLPYTNVVLLRAGEEIDLYLGYARDNINLKLLLDILFLRLWSDFRK